MKRITFLLFLCVIIFSCKTKEVEKVISTRTHIHELKKNLVQEKSYIVDAISTKLTSIHVPYASSHIISKVKYYDNAGGFFVDTTFTGLGISKLFTHLSDRKKTLIALNKEILEVNINEQKSNIIEEDGIKFAYNNNDDYSYNLMLRSVSVEIGMRC